MYQTCSEKCEECIRLNKCYLTAQAITYSCPSCRHKLRAPNNPLCDGDTDERGLVNLVFFKIMYFLQSNKKHEFLCVQTGGAAMFGMKEMNAIILKPRLNWSGILYLVLRVDYHVLINIKYKLTVFSHKNACYVNWKKLCLQTWYRWLVQRNTISTDSISQGSFCCVSLFDLFLKLIL